MNYTTRPTASPASFDIRSVVAHPPIEIINDGVLTPHEKNTLHHGLSNLASATGLQTKTIATVEPTGHSQIFLGWARVLFSRGEIRAEVLAPRALLLATLLSRVERQVSRSLRGGPIRYWPSRNHAGHSFDARIDEINHRKYKAVRVESQQEAIRRLETLDRFAYLFLDSWTKREAIVYRSHLQTIRISRVQDGLDMDHRPYGGFVAGDPLPAAVMGEPDAINHMAATSSRFYFFEDSHDGHGKLLYRRFDGSLGLIAPSSSRGDIASPTA